MDQDPTSVLIVAHQTAATPALPEAVRERARSGPSRFHLLVPRRRRSGKRWPTRRGLAYRRRARYCATRCRS
jgi:hypothetical protein